MLSLLLCFGVFFKDLLPLQEHAVKCLRNIAKNIQRGDICLEKYNGILLETSIWETVIHHIIILPTQTFRRKKQRKMWLMFISTAIAKWKSQQRDI